MGVVELVAVEPGFLPPSPDVPAIVVVVGVWVPVPVVVGALVEGEVCGVVAALATFDALAK